MSIPRKNRGLAMAICVCGKCFNEYARHFIGIRMSDEGWTKVMLCYLDGTCPKGKLKVPRPELHVVKTP